MKIWNAGYVLMIASLVLVAVGVIHVESGEARQAAPTASIVDVPAVTECRVAPRPLNEALMIVRAAYASAGTPTPTPTGGTVIESNEAGVSVRIEGTAWVVDDFAVSAPSAPSVEFGTTAEVMAALRESVACRNAGDLPRWMALHTDAWLAAFAGAWAEPDERGTPKLPEAAWSELLTAAPSPELPENLLHAPEPVGLWMLSDGRVAAVSTVVGEPGGEPLHFVVLARGRDGWLIDIEIPLRGFAPSAAAPQAALVGP